MFCLLGNLNNECTESSSVSLINGHFKTIFPELCWIEEVYIQGDLNNECAESFPVSSKQPIETFFWVKLYQLEGICVPGDLKVWMSLPQYHWPTAIWRSFSDRRTLPTCEPLSHGRPEWWMYRVSLSASNQRLFQDHLPTKLYQTKELHVQGDLNNEHALPSVTNGQPFQDLFYIKLYWLEVPNLLGDLTNACAEFCPMELLKGHFKTIFQKYY